MIRENLAREFLERLEKSESDNAVLRVELERLKICGTRNTELLSTVNEQAAILGELQVENVALRAVRSAVLEYLKISDTEYALGPFPGENEYEPSFLKLLRALHATITVNAGRHL